MIKLDSIKLKNYKGFSALELNLDEKLTVIAGVNGAGKSSILDALAMMLSWVVSRVKNANGSGKYIQPADIHNGKKHAFVSVSTNDSNSWTLSKTQQGYTKALESSDLRYVSEIAKYLQNVITNTDACCSIPVFVYYPVHRSVLDIPVRIRTRHDFSLLEAYDEALTKGANFRHFFEWFRIREDLENENYRSTLEDKKFIGDKELNAVRNALEKFMPNFKEFRVQRNPLAMVVMKHGKKVRVDQLSDGEKCMMALVGDLARRLAIANPILDNPLEGDGIVLIDELELHLHPNWQRRSIRQLKEVFPNCQFIISTHSPQILGEVEGRQLRILKRLESGEVQINIPEQSYGLTSIAILEELMEGEGRTTKVDKQLDQIFRLIDQEDFTYAKTMISELESELNGDIPELIKAKSLIFMME